MPTAVEWMEMDARTIHFHISTQWMVDVEWIASLRASNATHKLERKFSNLENQVTELNAQNRALEEELSKLKATMEDKIKQAAASQRQAFA